MTRATRPGSAEAVRVRPLEVDDLDVADRVLRLAFGTFRELPDPSAAFGDSDLLRTRFRAAPECAWAAEIDGEVVGSVLAARWGSFAFFGPLSVRADLWDRGIGSRLLRPVLDAFAGWEVRQAGLFTFASSPKHLALYQKHGFWPGTLTAVTAKAVEHRSSPRYTLFSAEPAAGHGDALDGIRELTDQVFAGLDLEREIVAAQAQGIGDTIVVARDGAVEGMAVCHSGAGSEAGSDTCYVKFGAVTPGEGAGERFEALLSACEAFAAESGLARVAAGINTGRLDAYRRMLACGFRAELIGVSMHLHPDSPHLDAAEQYVIDDLR